MLILHASLAPIAIHGNLETVFNNVAAGIREAEAPCSEKKSVPVVVCDVVPLEHPTPFVLLEILDKFRVLQMAKTP